MWRSRPATGLPSTTTISTERRGGQSNPPRSRTLLADTFYWIALIFPRDGFHAAVSSFSRTLGSARLVTTDEILSEVLSHFAGLGPYWRAKVAAVAHAVRAAPGVDVRPPTRA